MVFQSSRQIFTEALVKAELKRTCKVTNICFASIIESNEVSESDGVIGIGRITAD
jgi:hypothetical protein